jgi:hypothetical protein
MTPEARLARAHGMDDAAWARHANPWSFWTRLPILPALALAVWSRVWIGWWAALPVLALLAWTWWNPRAFPPPRSTGSWPARAVLGERLWLARREVPVPPRHRVLPHLATAVALLGALAMAWGLARLELVPTMLGTAVALLGKLWFLRHMVALTREMADDLRLAAWQAPRRG